MLRRYALRYSLREYEDKFMPPVPRRTYGAVIAVTILTKPVRRKTTATVREQGKSRQLTVTIYPNNTIGLRPSKLRTEEIITLDSVYALAVRQRVAKERADKKSKRKVTIRYAG